MPEGVGRVKDRISVCIGRIRERKVTHHDLVRLLLTCWRIYQARGLIGHMLQPYDSSGQSDTRSTRSDELDEEALHVGEVDKTTMQEGFIVPGLEFCLKPPIDKPPTIKAVVCLIDCILIESGPLPPLQAGNLAKDTFPCIEVVEQRSHLIGQHIVIAHGYDVGTAYIELAA